MLSRTLLTILFAVGCQQQPLNAAEGSAQPESVNAGAVGNPYQRWELGPNRAKDFFPIAVWLQSPSNAPRFQAAGINLYIGLYQGPTEAQLATLKKHNMPVICEQNEVGLAHIDDPLIVAWAHDDEPDMARDFKKFWNSDVKKLQAAWPGLYDDLGPDKPYKGWGIGIPPAWIVRDYQAIKAKDPRRPVFLNMSVDVAYEQWPGRGDRTGKTEDIPEYLKGCDIGSFDIYPACDDKKEVKGNLWLVPKGVSNLRTWSNDRKIVWNCIECTAISDLSRKPRPRDTRAEVWMSLIHGSMGLVYFVHQFKPFNEHALLQDAEMLAEVTRTNKQIHELAPVLNSPSSATPATVVSANAEVPVAAMTKVNGTTTHVFAVAMRPGDTKATITVPGTTTATVTVLGENRTIALTGGKFEDAFNDWDVHLYEIKP
ncbi:MAG: hypothetical protein AAB263_11635 [Planctomycetota bacterium]